VLQYILTLHKQEQQMFTLLFLNDANETEHYGNFATRTSAEDVIAKVQAEYGDDAFATDAFEILED
jgi:hypothetical protein